MFAQSRSLRQKFVPDLQQKKVSNPAGADKQKRVWDLPIFYDEEGMMYSRSHKLLFEWTLLSAFVCFFRTNWTERSVIPDKYRQRSAVHLAFKLKTL